MVRIEDPCLSDCPALGRLFLEDMRHLGVEVSLESLETLAENVVRALDQDPRPLLCRVARIVEADGSVQTVGVLLAHYFYSLKFGGRALWIEELYVSPIARRKGIGRLLVEDLLDFAETKNDILGIDLEAYHGNTPASILYRSLGFQRLGRERFSYPL